MACEETFVLDDEQKKCLQLMRETFQNRHGYGLEMSDVTFLRYLRAR